MNSNLLYFCTNNAHEIQLKIEPPQTQVNSCATKKSKIVCSVNKCTNVKLTLGYGYCNGMTDLHHIYVTMKWMNQIYWTTHTIQWTVMVDKQWQKSKKSTKSLKCRYNLNYLVIGDPFILPTKYNSTLMWQLKFLKIKTTAKNHEKSDP